MLRDLQLILDALAGVSNLKAIQICRLIWADTDQFLGAKIDDTFVNSLIPKVRETLLGGRNDKRGTGQAFN